MRATGPRRGRRVRDRPGVLVGPADGDGRAALDGLARAAGRRHQLADARGVEPHRALRAEECDVDDRRLHTLAAGRPDAQILRAHDDDDVLALGEALGPRDRALAAARDRDAVAPVAVARRDDPAELVGGADEIGDERRARTAVDLLGRSDTISRACFMISSFDADPHDSPRGPATL